MSKKSTSGGGVAVDELRDDVRQTRQQLGETTEALADKTRSTGKRSMVGAAVAVVVAAAAAAGAWRWTQSRRTPKSKAKRMWRDVKGRARDVRKDVKGRARDVKSRIS